MIGIVLSRRDFREYDQIISVYTKEGGKREALARGVKKIISKNTAALEPFSLLEIEFVPGKEVDYITTVQSFIFFGKIHGDLKKMVWARYVLGLVDTLVSVGEEDQALFGLLQDWLACINDADDPSSLLVPSFVIQLFARLGFAPQLDSCLQCEKSIDLEQLKFYFIISRGGLIHESCLSSATIQAERYIVMSYKDIELLRALSINSFDQINKMVVLPEQESTLHSIVYNFSLYHAAKKVPDWRAVDKFFLEGI